MLGLGVGIDYALFILARHRQNLDEGMTVPEAIGQANSSAGLSVLFAGVTVIVAIAGLQVSGVPMMTMMGWASALMVAVVMTGRDDPAARDPRNRRPQGQRRQDPVHQAAPGQRPQLGIGPLGGHVVKHPVRYGVAAARRARPARGSGVLDAARLPRRQQRRCRRRRPARPTTSWPTPTVPGTNGPFQVVLETHGAKDTDAAVARVTKALAADEGVASVEQPVFNEGKDLAMIGVTPTSAPQDDETSATLDRLRTEVLPDAIGDSDIDPMVTGGTAITGGRLESPAGAHAVLPGCCARAVVPDPDARVSLGVGAAEGGCAEPAQRRSRVRRRRRGVPVGLGSQPDRCSRSRSRSCRWHRC